MGAIGWFYYRSLNWERFNMESNVGPYDQLIRIIIGVTAGWELFLVPKHWWLLLFSFGFLLSGLMGICPIYKLTGISSNGSRTKSDGSSHCSPE